MGMNAKMSLGPEVVYQPKKEAKGYEDQSEANEFPRISSFNWLFLP